MENRKTSLLHSTNRFLASEPALLCAWIALSGFLTLSLVIGPTPAGDPVPRDSASVRTSLDEDSMRPLDPPDPVLARPFELRFESDEARAEKPARLLYADRRTKAK